jgi:quercetin dioxygenase-like cupin family protein
MARIANTEVIHVGCMHIPLGGGVGRHLAASPQLFIVVDGAGWVQGGDGVAVPIGAGEAALWQRDEEHAAGTDTGMTAIVVEGEALAGNPEDIGSRENAKETVP